MRLLPILQFTTLAHQIMKASMQAKHTSFSLPLLHQWVDDASFATFLLSFELLPRSFLAMNGTHPLMDHRSS
jgi:hypothetical protein